MSYEKQGYDVVDVAESEHEANMSEKNFTPTLDDESERHEGGGEVLLGHVCFVF
jgi:hypothetical protein